MDKIVIRGGNPLSGSIEVSGMKNAAVAIIFGTILTEDKCILENVSLDVLGVCKDCIYVEVDRDIIDVLRKRELEEEKNT